MLIWNSHTIAHLGSHKKKVGNLPIVIVSYPTIAAIHFQDAALFSSGSPCEKFLSITDHNNQNILPSQKYPLLLHHKLGHSGFQWFQNICQIPKEPSQEKIIKPNTTPVTTCYAPLCSACHMVNNNLCTPDRHATGHTEPMLVHEFHLLPGSCISIDQYISSVPRCLPYTKGK